MPQFTLTLTWTATGANPHHPVPVPERRRKAIAVANSNHVRNSHGLPIQDNGVDIIPTATGAIWNVDGQVADVRNMISTWVAHGNVAVSGGP
jgi:hypothetical protein